MMNKICHQIELMQKRHHDNDANGNMDLVNVAKKVDNLRI